MKIVLATRNAHKVEELRRMAPQIDWVGMPDELPDPPETGDTFTENALQKAEFVYAATGLPTLADDSGLAVEALGGRPGVHSKRYSAEGTDAANNRKLLAELDGVSDRRAAYHCVIALCGSNLREITIGKVEGKIGFTPQGTNGFGYDPLFWPEEVAGRSMAELSPTEKDGISHRGRALRQMLERLDMTRAP